MSLPAIVGIDTGGTFTDLIAFVDGEVRTHKVLSTPADPSVAVLRGLRELLAEGSAALVTYASTVATNALLERRGARVVLLTTAGFEDVIEIGRQNRPRLYALEPHRPQPLVARKRRIGVVERILFDGKVLVPLRVGQVDEIVDRVRRQKPQSLAVCFLHSYANPVHERQLGAALRRIPDVFVSLSHQLIPEYREYERTSTTVINAYVGPIMESHLRSLTRGLRGHTVRVMQSNGGAISPRLAGREAVRTLLSGPAAGVVAALAVARSLGLKRALTFDMGGTSTDVSLIEGRARQSTIWEIGGLPVKVPAIDIHTVGAGGGSIAYLDSGGALKVGPRSAGADPGPACYGKGSEPTVTDANLVLGRLVQGAFLGGRMCLDRGRAERALSELASRAGLTPQVAAEGVVRVANAGMERAIRRISVERGHDPRDYALIVFGGAGGQHACELAMGLGIRQVIVPRHPGLLSAWGAAIAEERRDFVRSLREVAPTAARLRQVFARLEAAARKAMGEGGYRTLRTLDVRYQGQGHEINIPFDSAYARAFHEAHQAQLGYRDLEREIEVVSLRVSLVAPGPRSPVRVRSVAIPRRLPPQPVLWNGSTLRARIYERDQLRAGRIVHGPALVCELSATTFVPPGWTLRVAPATGHLELRHAH